MAYKIAIIGPKDVISGFRALDVVPFDAQSSEEALEIMKKIKKEVSDPSYNGEKYAVVMIIESLVKDIPFEEYQKVGAGALPAFLSIPGIEGASEAGILKLKKLAEKAIGSDILK